MLVLVVCVLSYNYVLCSCALCMIVHTSGLLVGPTATVSSGAACLLTASYVQPGWIARTYTL